MNIALWFSLWCLVWGGFYGLLRAGINYISSPCLTSLYFFSGAITASVLFRDLFTAHVRRALWDWRLLLPLLALCLGLIVYTLNGLFLVIPESLISRQPDMFFLSSNPWYLIPKAFDILFQQILLFCLALLLAQKGLSVSRISFICLALFGGAHLFLMAKNGIIVGGYFLLASSTAGWLFPRLLLRHPWGIAYTFSLHILFYVGTTLFSCLCPTPFLL
jgi:hypothetical protein